MKPLFYEAHNAETFLTDTKIKSPGMKLYLYPQGKTYTSTSQGPSPAIYSLHHRHEWPHYSDLEYWRMLSPHRNTHYNRSCTGNSLMKMEGSKCKLAQRFEVN